jgi:hypothetical protein
MFSAACTPFPLTGITAFAACELMTVMLPVTDSELAGVNVTLREAVCPGPITLGVVIPLAVKFFAFTVI